MGANGVTVTTQDGTTQTSVTISNSSATGSVISGENNVGLGSYALYNNTSGSRNVAIGMYSLNNNTTGNNNIAIGQNAYRSNNAGNNNVIIGYYALNSNSTTSDMCVIGSNTDSGNFSGGIILGNSAYATANNQFVVGSIGNNAGSVTAEVNSSTQVWNVVINGVARKILLA